MKKAIRIITDNVALIGLALVLLTGTLVSPSFLTLENLSNVLRSASIMGCVAVGMTFVILCGSIDLSVSSMFALSGYCFIVLSQQSIALAILVPLAVGIAVGILNGFLVAKLSIPSFVGTLATMLFVRGLVLLLTGETTIKAENGLPEALVFIGRGSFFQRISMPLVLFLVIAAIAAYVLKKRPIGRAMYIVGGNQEAARMMGVSVAKTTFIAHAVCSLLAAAGGTILASRVGSAYPLAGDGYELYAIAAVVIGGASLNGGIGKMSGTMLGTLIMGSFTNIFNLQKTLNPVWENAVVGSILLIVVLLQAISRRMDVTVYKVGKKLKT